MKHSTGIAIVCVVLGIAGCGSDDSDSNAAPASDATAGRTAASSDGENATVGDACTMITDADVTALIGAHGPGQPSSRGTDGPGCFWENPDTYYSVTIDIGNPGTAVNGTLPPLPDGIEADPLPDGMRNLGGAVEFAAGGRDNSVQVVNGESAAAQQQHAIELARKIADQLGG